MNISLLALDAVDHARRWRVDKRRHLNAQPSMNGFHSFVDGLRYIGEEILKQHGRDVRGTIRSQLCDRSGNLQLELHKEIHQPRLPASRAAP